MTPVPSGGAGFSTDPRAREAVEDRAMALSKDRLDTDGCQVEDVSASKSLDYVARKGGAGLHVEMMGRGARCPRCC